MTTLETNPSPSTSSVNELVEHWATQTPDATAIVSHDERLTYAELDSYANDIAAALLERGVEPDARVVVAVPRSATAFAAFLGVLKAGAAYVPIDLAYPEERQALLAEDSRPHAIVTTSEHTERFSASPVPVPVVAVDTIERGRGTDVGARVHGAGRHAAAYVIYTSGSTGRPKGVVVEHGAVLDLIQDDERLRVAAGDTVAQYAPLAFDASTFEIWCALGRGATVAIIAGGKVSIERLGAELRYWKPDWLFLTTGLFHVLVDYDLDALRHVGCLITGGDVLSPAHVRAAAGAAGRVYAAYGPTETTVYASLHRATADEDVSRVPIGSALTGNNVFVTGDDGELAADGAIGELLIGGSGVARGYHDRPRLTAERFVPDPHATEPGARLYRTGDLVRELPDGELEFHGRRDGQVKVRGFRVELGEIEAALAEHRDVAIAAASALPGADGSRRLAAYCSLRPGASVVSSDIRAWIRDRMPDYMVPAALLVVDDLPLDPNGKVDRAVLPYPWTNRDAFDDLPSYTEPATEVERTIAAAWADSLELDRIGLDDNFYEVGGDSLRSVDVLERLRLRGVEVSAQEFFRIQTVRELAMFVVEREPELAAT